MTEAPPDAVARSAAPLTTRKRLTLGFAVGCLVLTVLAAGAEVMARLRGFEPWTPAKDPALRVEPGGTLGRPDPLLGSAYRPGRFVVTLADGYAFRVTHDADGHRITRPLSGDGAAARSQLWILGCSYTHGWSLDDEDTYPWLVQERLPDYDVVNFGVGGYGTLQSLLQFREAVARGPAPRVAVLAYGSFHDARNTLNRYRTKGITLTADRASVPLPCARLRPDGGLEIFTVEADHYRPWPLQGQLAFVHMLEERANRRELLQLRGGRVF